jgi:predicted DNA-binding transcriptional regulator YafY
MIYMTKNVTNLQKSILNYFKKPYYNDLTVNQAATRFGVSTRTVTSNINQLRKAGFAIYTNAKTLNSGRVANMLRLGKPSKAYKTALRAGKHSAAIRVLEARAA